MLKRKVDDRKKKIMMAHQASAEQLLQLGEGEEGGGMGINWLFMTGNEVFGRAHPHAY